jgi:outer membrane protein assembly factor BamE (lipoprotein component of BamABCDE complex)
MRWSMMSAAVVVVAALGAAGCSPVMAAHQPSRKDVDLLSPGMPRNTLLAELGQPVASDVKNGQRVEVFSFVQGYRKGVRIGRTIGHAAADVMTLGLWEVAGTPTEATLNGHNVAYEVTYDASDRVEQVVPLKK